MEVNLESSLLAILYERKAISCSPKADLMHTKIGFGIEWLPIRNTEPKKGDLTPALSMGKYRRKELSLQRLSAVVD